MWGELCGQVRSAGDENIAGDKKYKICPSFLKWDGRKKVLCIYTLAYLYLGIEVIEWSKVKV